MKPDVSSVSVRNVCVCVCVNLPRSFAAISGRAKSVAQNEDDGGNCGRSACLA